MINSEGGNLKSKTNYVNSAVYNIGLKRLLLFWIHIDVQFNLPCPVVVFIVITY